MRIYKLHKFTDGTLNDVRSTLDDILKQIRIEYLPQTVWRNVDRERARAMIQAIDRQLRNIRFDTSAGNPVKKILLKLNLPDHRILKDGHGVLKLKKFKKDTALKLFKSTHQEMYDHVGPEVTSSQDDKVYKMAKQDYAWLMISRCSRSQDKGTSSSLKSMITTSIHKLMVEVKDYELKTRNKA
ncbi:hypothetical protein Tco_0967968 [Tanacetum coccineum]